MPNGWSLSIPSTAISGNSCWQQRCRTILAVRGTRRNCAPEGSISRTRSRNGRKTLTVSTGTDGLLPDEPHEGATGEYADLLHQLNLELQREDPSHHVDGSSHHWEVIVNWHCSVCGRQQQSRPHDYAGGSSTIPRRSKDRTRMGTSGVTRSNKNTGRKRLPIQPRGSHGEAQ